MSKVVENMLFAALIAQIAYWGWRWTGIDDAARDAHLAFLIAYFGWMARK